MLSTFLSSRRADPVRVFTTIAIAAVLLLAAVGCGPAEKRVATAPVKGKISYKGAPVTTGNVMFIPSGGGPPATAEIQADGTYSLKTYEPEDGAVPGDHVVTVTAIQLSTGSPEDPASDPKLLVPTKYSSSKTSGLTASVADGENAVDFDLDGAMK